MSLTQAQISAAAEALDEAERTRTQIGLLSLAYPAMTMDDAYAIQAAWIDKKLARGRRIIGRKIGLTSKAMQAALNIDIPDSGLLLDDMRFEDGAQIPRDRFIQPRVEAEVAFVMSTDLSGPDVTLFDALDATAYVCPAIEILDTRVLRTDPATGTARVVHDTIADNAADAGIVVGGRPVSPHEVDLRWVGAIVSANAEVIETGLGAAVLNHPANGIAWLANRLAEQDDGLQAGDIVLSGSFIRPLEAPPGTTITADFGPLGSVSCHFAA